MYSDSKIEVRHRSHGFSLVEMLVVIAIMSILMTAGAIGIGSMTGKGVTSAVASAESLFDEARSIAVGQRTRTRVLVSKTLTNVPAENLRRVVVVSEELNTDGTPKAGSWILSSRGVTLPDQVFFSQNLSQKDHKSGGALEEMDMAGAKAAFQGRYFYYEFNSEGICTTPAASFVVGAGARNKTTNKPRLTAAGKRDFGGFVVWRNGRTSAFRSPTQISGATSLNTNSEF